MRAAEVSGDDRVQDQSTHSAAPRSDLQRAKKGASLGVACGAALVAANERVAQNVARIAWLEQGLQQDVRLCRARGLAHEFDLGAPPERGVFLFTRIFLALVVVTAVAGRGGSGVVVKAWGRRTAQPINTTRHNVKASRFMSASLRS